MLEIVGTIYCEMCKSSSLEVVETLKNGSLVEFSLLQIKKMKIQYNKNVKLRMEMMLHTHKNIPERTKFVMNAFSLLSINF